MTQTQCENTKYTLILTATVNPAPQKNLVIADPIERENEYITSLRHWMDFDSIGPIYFCDNSGWNLSKIKECVENDKRVNFLSIAPPNREIERGKGYCEIGLISAVLEEIKENEDLCLIVKSTGRNWVDNFDDIASRIPINVPGLLISDLSRNLKYSDSRFFIAPISFYHGYVLPERHFLNDDLGKAFENMLARWTLKWVADGNSWLMPMQYPKICGKSGSRGIKYSFSPARWLAFHFRKYFFGR